MARKSPSQAQLLEYLVEHLAYEREMLGYTYGAIHAPKERLPWNAHFESFSVHARNLYRFLRSKEDGNTSIRANHYVEQAKADHLTDFEDVEIAVMHLSRGRLASKKVDLDQADRLAQWIDNAWTRWCSALANPYRDNVSADPVCRLSRLSIGADGRFATNTVRYTTTNTEVYTTSFRPPPEKKDSK
jgi:hypothetical protein